MQVHPTEPQNLGTPDPLHTRIQESFDRQGLMRHLGAELVNVEPGLVVIRMPFSPTLTQHNGYFHAGASSSIADTAGGYAGFTVFPEGASVLTVEFKINLLAPAKGEYLEATGKVIRSGRTLTICQLEVHAYDGEARNLVALGQQTLICLQNTPAI
jgi:uncharacterized protein (TIGR00369 family)